MGFEGGKETLRKLLRVMGFTYVKSDGNRYLNLKEKPEVQAQRLTFLTKYVAVRTDFYLVFTDETWIFRRGTVRLRAWENNVRSCASIVRLLSQFDKKKSHFLSPCSHGDFSFPWG